MVAAALQDTCESLNYFGYACLFGTYSKMSMARSLGGVAAWTDELGERFENIYPILIGPVASCEGLAAVLGDRCSLICISEQAPIAIVSIAPGKVDEIRRDPIAKEWVVIRDLSRINAPAGTLDAISLLSKLAGEPVDTADKLGIRTLFRTVAQSRLPPGFSQL